MGADRKTDPADAGFLDHGGPIRLWRPDTRTGGARVVSSGPMTDEDRSGQRYLHHYRHAAGLMRPAPSVGCCEQV